MTFELIVVVPDGGAFSFQIVFARQLVEPTIVVQPVLHIFVHVLVPPLSWDATELGILEPKAATRSIALMLSAATGIPATIAKERRGFIFNSLLFFTRCQISTEGPRERSRYSFRTQFGDLIHLALDS